MKTKRSLLFFFLVALSVLSIVFLFSPPAAETACFLSTASVSDYRRFLQGLLSTDGKRPNKNKIAQPAVDSAALAVEEEEADEPTTNNNNKNNNDENKNNKNKNNKNKNNKNNKKKEKRCQGGGPTIPLGTTTLLDVPTAADGDRTVAVYVPTAYRTRHGDATATTFTAAPALLLFHGLNDDCERFVKNTGFIEFAESDGVLLLSFCGTAGWLGTAFNAGMCCGFTGDSPDELDFVRQALRTVGYPEKETNRETNEGNEENEENEENETNKKMSNHAQLCINEEKMLTVGFSNGAMLAEVLACRAPTLFRAVASVGGVTEPRPGGAEGLAKCTADIQANNPANRRPSVLMIHGDADQMVPWEGSWFLGFPTIPENVAAWTQRNGCDPARTSSTVNNSFFVNTIYEGCTVDADTGNESTQETASATNTTVEIVRVIGGAHLWPERDGFSTTEHIYAFGAAALGGWD